MQYWSVLDYVLRRAPVSMADDVVAETFLVAWRRSNMLPADPLPWLLGVARRVLANQHRGARRQLALREKLVRLSGRGDAGWNAPPRVSAELGAALKSLPPREREAVLLVAWEGLEPARAAIAAGCTPATFRVRLHRARRRLVATLGSADVMPSASEAAGDVR